jgi:hypothetical protein
MELTGRFDKIRGPRSLETGFASFEEAVIKESTVSGYNSVPFQSASSE